MADVSPAGSPPAGVITGVVRDEHGRPLAEASVSLADAPVPVPDIAAQTAADGTFTLAAPARGHYEVVATGPSGGAARVAVEVGAGQASAPLELIVSSEGPGLR